MEGHLRRCVQSIRTPLQRSALLLQVLELRRLRMVQILGLLQLRTQPSLLLVHVVIAEVIAEVFP
jgi:hypothetical protein